MREWLAAVDEAWNWVLGVQCQRIQSSQVTFRRCSKITSLLGFVIHLKENSVFLKPRPYFLFEIRLSTHREQFGEDRRPLRAI